MYVIECDVYVCDVYVCACVRATGCDCTVRLFKWGKSFDQFLPTGHYQYIFPIYFQQFMCAAMLSHNQSMAHYLWYEREREGARMALGNNNIKYCLPERKRERKKKGAGRRKRKERGRRKMEGKNRKKERMERSDTHLLHTNCSHMTTNLHAILVTALSFQPLLSLTLQCAHCESLLVWLKERQG